MTICFVYIGEHLCSEEIHVEEFKDAGLDACNLLIAQERERKHTRTHTKDIYIYAYNCKRFTCVYIYLYTHTLREREKANLAKC